MALRNMRFRVYLDHSEPADVLVLPADRMRAERASTTELPPSQRGPHAVQAHSETWVLLWLWCACTRLGHAAEPFASWADRVLDYDRLNENGTVVGEEDETAEDETVDPTQPGAATT